MLLEPALQRRPQQRLGEPHLGIVLGFVFFVVPGLIALTFWAVISPVIVVERAGAFTAFGRSQELVRGNAWQVFGTVLVGFLVVAAGIVGTAALAAALADGPLLRIVLGALGLRSPSRSPPCSPRSSTSACGGRGRAGRDRGRSVDGWRIGDPIGS